MKNIRLEKIADMVIEGVTAADIGTDHALLPILLVQQKKCRKVYACDVARGPLKAAAENIQKAGLSAFIETRLSDGLENVPDDADACVIAGMGCVTAIEILTAGEARLKKMKQIIVEVNRNTADMRKWISDHGYTIEDEIYIRDRGHDYISISFTAKEHRPYTSEEILLGPVLMKKREEAFLAYCQRRKEKIDQILAASNGNAFQRDAVEADRKIYINYLKQ